VSDRFDKFSPEAKRVLTLAQEEAKRFNHNYIGTEHLLLGLVRQEDGTAARILDAMGVSVRKVRDAVEFIVGRGDRVVIGDISFTPRAKRSLELTVEEARRLGDRSMGPEHLLLGLVAEGEGIAAGVLRSLGVTLEAVRTRVLNELAGTGKGETPGTDKSEKTRSTNARPMTATERGHFLRQPLVASVGCVDETGAPYVVPSWFDYDGESFWLVPRAKSAWARYLQRDGRVCLSIDQRGGASARVQVMGHAEIVEEPNVGGAWVPIATRMAARYLGAEDGPRYLNPTLDRPRWLIRIRPAQITTWAGGGWHRRYVEGATPE